MWDLARRHLRAQRAVERELPEIDCSPRADGDFALSATQRRLWRLMASPSGERPAYNITLSIRLLGPLDDDAMRLALRDVVNRHDALRTVFSDERGRPSQRVLASYQCLPSYCYEITSGVVAAESRWLVDEASRRFDLVSGPAFRLAVHRYSGDECLLFLLGHHLALDGRSIAVIFDELEVLYNAYLGGEAAELPAPAAQHGDFVRWQQRWLDSPAADRYLGYWTRLPGDRLDRCAESGPADYAGGRILTELPAAVAERVRSLAARENVTIAAVYLAAFAALLEPALGAPPIVGVPAANRGIPRLGRVVGYLANVLPIAMRPRDWLTFRQAVHETDDSLGSAYAHQAMPIERVVEYRCGECAAVPIDAFFATYRDNLEAELRLRGIRRGTNAFAPAKDTEFPLILTVVDGREGAVIMWSFRYRDHSEASAGKLAHRYAGLLDAATRRPEQQPAPGV